LSRKQKAESRQKKEGIYGDEKKDNYHLGDIIRSWSCCFDNDTGTS
jgi:hypothetical protein